MVGISEAIAKGDETAFKELFELCYGKLFHFAKSFVIDKETAREIVQEAFIRLWEVRTRLKPEINPEALLITIVRNNSLNYLKHCMVERKYSQLARQHMESYRLNYAALKNDTIEKLYYTEMQELLDNAIENLPPRCRAVFELSRKSEMKNKEIAEKLNISVKTVENQITEALKRLRAAVKEHL